MKQSLEYWPHSICIRIPALSAAEAEAASALAVALAAAFSDW
jgi:hypothetical protein